MLSLFSSRQRCLFPLDYSWSYLALNPVGSRKVSLFISSKMLTSPNRRLQKAIQCVISRPVIALFWGRVLFALEKCKQSKECIIRGDGICASAIITLSEVKSKVNIHEFTLNHYFTTAFLKICDEVYTFAFSCTSVRNL